jgi:hypothetical protein
MANMIITIILINTDIPIIYHDYSFDWQIFLLNDHVNITLL